MGEKIEFEARMWILHGGASILGGNRLIKVPPGVDVEDKIYRVTLEPFEPEPKLCPFCGGEAEAIYHPAHGWYVQCNLCKARTRFTDSEFDAIHRWNERAL